MSEPIYCTAQTFAGNRFEPREYCTNQVDDYGDLCAEHDAAARMEDEYERRLDAQRYPD